RDLKPANIMLVAGGASGSDVATVKLVDFGIARSLLGEFSQATASGSTPIVATTLTKAGMVLGTPAYSTPEQLAGEPLDAHSDLYALAVIASELLGGQHPSPPASPREMIVQRLTGRPRRVSDVMKPEDAPWAAAVQPVFDRALDPDPTKRTD